MLRWLLLSMVLVVAVSMLAGATTEFTIGAMRAMSDFASAVRQVDSTLILYFNLVAYPAVTAAILGYLWPLLQFAWRGALPPVPAEVQRRAVSAPLVVAVTTFLPWLVSLAFFPAATVFRFGHWSPELMSQHILSPVINGFLAATASYFLLDWAFRRGVVPHVFPDGDLLRVVGAWPIGTRGRLVLFLVAVAFAPQFTMLGLSRGAADRIAAGVEIARIVELLEVASTIAFVVYLAVGVGLTVLLAKWLTQPLAAVADALRRVQRGDLDVAVSVTSADEVGVLEDGVNQMVAALRDRERILVTFGRVVEPVVRDRLLDGGIERAGELRTATVLFCDLREFTAFAERTPPQGVVATLNEFFSAMTEEVRRTGGFVDKFIGDAMLVVYGLFEGSPGTMSAHGAAAAVDCAVGMSERLKRLNADRALRGEPPLAISASLHSGELVAGTLGAADRHEYTVIGDTVNVAARLLQVAKERDWEFLVSETTARLVHAAGFACTTEPGGAVDLRGRREPVAVSRLVTDVPVAAAGPAQRNG
jgi:adenylate cyclase